VEFFEVVEARHSVRSFQARPVEEEKIVRILDAANRAPSAGNLQAYEIFRVARREVLERLARAAFGQGFLAEAPVALVFCANPARSSRDYGARGASLYAVQDATIACTFSWLAATAQGLASVWIGAFDDDAVRKEIGVGPELIPVAVLPIGYAGQIPEPTSRRRISSLVHRVEEAIR